MQLNKTTTLSTVKSSKSKRENSFFNEVYRNKSLYLMTLPGILLLAIFSYIPMLGIFIAFKDYNYAKGPIFSNWNGFTNFKFFLTTPDAFLITRNTVLYNLAFIFSGVIISISFAIALNELKSKMLAKIYQTIMILPFFLSWVIAGYLLFSLLSMDKGFFNNVIFKAMGIEPVSWYSENKHWPIIMLLANTWKYAGYNAIIYLATIVGIDSEIYEAAIIDGATKWQQIKKITIPMLIPMICILVLLQVGRMFSADFGMFFNLPLDNGALYPSTNVIDTYVYRALMNTRDIGMSAAAGLYQSLVGFILVLASNLIVKRINPERSLF